MTSVRCCCHADEKGIFGICIELAWLLALDVGTTDTILWVYNDSTIRLIEGKAPIAGNAKCQDVLVHSAERIAQLYNHDCLIISQALCHQIGWPPQQSSARVRNELFTSVLALVPNSLSGMLVALKSGTRSNREHCSMSTGAWPTFPASPSVLQRHSPTQLKEKVLSSPHRAPLAHSRLHCMCQSMIMHDRGLICA